MPYKVPGLPEHQWIAGLLVHSWKDPFYKAGAGMANIIYSSGNLFRRLAYLRERRQEDDDHTQDRVEIQRQPEILQSLRFLITDLD
jgi:hypothetical protein